MQSSPFANHLRRNATEPERKLWFHLRARQMAGHHFRRQAPIGPYVVDFVCKKARLVVELDGGRHANRRTYDARRTAYLEARGYRVIRFWNFEVRFEMEGVLAAIFAALADPLPASPCKQGEEI